MAMLFGLNVDNASEVKKLAGRFNQTVFIVAAGRLFSVSYQ